MIGFDAVTYAYEPGVPIFEDLTLNFPRGEITALTGPSGTGKSTALYVAGLLLKATAGQVLYDGVQVPSRDILRSRLRAQTLGFLFQDASLDSSRTILQNILEPAFYAGVSPASVRQRALALMNSVGVELPPDRRPGGVSGGQAQRIALCRALLLEPSVVLADEPTGNLDSDSARAVMKVLQHACCSGATVVLATHDDRIIGYSRNVVAL